MTRRFQFSLGRLLALTTLAAITAWIATLGSFVFVTAFPVFVAALWGIYRRDRVFLCAFFLVVATMAIFTLAADLRGY
ncbi:MAG TPA: hypothetical protein VG125_28420 [Pirellulales bacterium]|jgi:hypothetical protein|nr:hypothetical protein [Pirellulales bacterium]